jgi:hypothetical protein
MGTSWHHGSPLSVCCPQHLLPSIYLLVDSSHMQFDPYATWSEGAMILLTVLISFACYLPAYIIPSPHRCTPFVITFFDHDGFRLATAGIIILSVLLLLLLISIMILGFETGLLKRLPRHINGPDVELLQQSHIGIPDRRLVYYGAGLFVQYVPAHLNNFNSSLS